MNKNLRETLNDIVVNSKIELDISNLDVSTAEIERLYKSLPIQIIRIGEEWGWEDTVFRDLSCEFCIENWHRLYEKL